MQQRISVVTFIRSNVIVHYLVLHYYFLHHLILHCLVLHYLVLHYLVLHYLVYTVALFLIGSGYIAALNSTVLIQLYTPVLGFIGRRSNS